MQLVSHCWKQNPGFLQQGGLPLPGKNALVAAFYSWEGVLYWPETRHAYLCGLEDQAIMGPPWLRSLCSRTCKLKEEMGVEWGGRETDPTNGLEETSVRGCFCHCGSAMGRFSVMAPVERSFPVSYLVIYRDYKKA